MDWFLYDRDLRLNNAETSLKLFTNIEDKVSDVAFTVFLVLINMRCNVNDCNCAEKDLILNLAINKVQLLQETSFLICSYF